MNARVVLIDTNAGSFEIGSYQGELFASLPRQSRWRIDELLGCAGSLGWDLGDDHQSGTLRTLDFTKP